MESLEFGIPIMINLDIKLRKELHDEAPPVINTKNSDEIYEKVNRK